MFVFTPNFSRADVQRVTEKMNAKIGKNSQLSARSKQILDSVSFSSEDLSKAASATAVILVSNLF